MLHLLNPAVLFSNMPAGPWWDLSDDGRRQLSLAFMSASFLWTIVFFLFAVVVFPQRSHDFCNRMVSEVHAFVAFGLATSAIDWSSPLSDVGGPNTSAEVLTMIISITYFIYDLFCCLVHDSTADPVTAIHHGFSILGLAWGIVTGHSGEELVACLWLMELSNPFMHARELFKEVGLRYADVLLVNDLLFILTYTIARMVIGPYVTYKTVMGNSSIGVKIGAVAIQVVSTLWFIKICRFAYYKIFARGESKPKAA